MTEFSYQLYSSRNFPPLSDTLAMVAGFGYSQVEGYGAMINADLDPGKLVAMLDANGLTMPTSHFSVEFLEDDPDGAIKLARTLGLKAVFAPHIAEPLRPTTASGWSAFGKRVAEAGKPLQDAGLSFGWHNHDFEMAQIEGEYVLDLILSASDSLAVELDLAWVQVGGLNPVDWIEKLSDRLVSVHLKDIAPAGQAKDEDGWADVGHGTIDWPAIVAALKKTNVQYHIAEHDNPNDDKRFAQRSIEAARNFLGA